MAPPSPSIQSHPNLNKTKATAGMQTTRLAARGWQAALEEKLADRPGFWEHLDEIGKQQTKQQQPDLFVDGQQQAQQEPGKKELARNKAFEEKLKFFMYAKDVHHQQGSTSKAAKDVPGSVFDTFPLDPTDKDYCEVISEWPDEDFLKSLDEDGQEQKPPKDEVLGDGDFNVESTPLLLMGKRRKSASTLTACTSTPYDSGRPLSNIENYILAQGITVRDGMSPINTINFSLTPTSSSTNVKKEPIGEQPLIDFDLSATTSMVEDLHLQE